MILIWRGWGIVVPIVWFVTLLIVQLLTNNVFGAGTYEAYSLPKIIGTIPAALILWAIGTAVNKDIYSDNKHAFFFISIEYWAFIVPALTVLFTFIF